MLETAINLEFGQKQIGLKEYIQIEPSSEKNVIQEKKKEEFYSRSRHNIKNVSKLSLISMTKLNLVHFKG